MLVHLLPLVLSFSAMAQEPGSLDLAEEADLHFQLGVEAYAEGDFRLALERMLRSNRLVPNRNVVFNIALCYEALGDYDEAYRFYAQTWASEPDAAQQRAIREAMEKLQARVALLEITSSPPGATVFIDRTDLGGRGVTPLVLALPQGDHEVILKLDGYETASVRAAATRGTSREVYQELEQLVGVVKIVGEAGFEVFHGESEGPLCTTPCEVELPIGQQELKITGEGYRPQVAVTNLPTPGSVTTIEAAPMRLTGTLRVDANVDDALVLVDGEPVGYTPLIAPVITGSRTVVVQADGFAPYEIEAAVRDGEVSDLGSVRLLPLNLVVSASRVEEDIFEAPSSVSVVHAGEIEAFGYPTLQEALRGTRGVTSIRNELDSMIMVRGVGTAANRGTQSKTLLNGVPLTDQLTGRQYLYSRSQNIQSIEVQRGSGSVLYGSGALTSLVSVRTRGRMEGTEGTVSAGTFGNEGRASVSGGAGTDDYGVRVYAGGVHGEGGPGTIPYSVAGGVFRPKPTTIDGYAPWRGGNVDLTAWAKELELFAQYAEDQVEVTSGAEGSVLTNLRGRSVTNPQRIRQLTLSASYRPKLSERTELDLNMHYRQSLFDNEATWQRSTAGVLLELLVDQRSAARWVGGGGQIISRPFDGLRVVSGAEVYRSTELSLEQATRIYLPAERRYAATEAQFDFQAAQLVYAAYSVADYQPIHLFKLSAGVRFDQWYKQAPQANPRLVGMLFPTDDDVIKLMVGRAFRAPVTYEQKYFVESISVPALDLRAESGWSYEAEYSHRLREWTGLASGWAASYDNVILSAVDPTIALQRYSNAGTTRVFGVDAEIRRDFSNGVMFSGWYSYQRPQVATDGGGWVDTPEQPNHLAAVKVVSPISHPELNIAARVVYEDRRPFRVDTLEGNSPGAVLGDLIFSGRARGGAVGWRAGVYNVLDTQFAAATYNSNPSPTLPQTFGRTFMASIDFHGRAKSLEKAL